jgi:hypothetical protein
MPRRPVRYSPEPDVTMEVVFLHQGSLAIYKMEGDSSGIADVRSREKTLS